MNRFIYSARHHLIKIIEDGILPVENITDALNILHIAPDKKKWLSFIDSLLLWLGGLAIAFSVLFFVAYNWSDMGRFAKFGMVEVLIVLAVAAYWKLGVDSVAGKVSLLMATIFLGVLLALYGQTYQTGADPWQLFFNWALLMLPWAFVGRYPAIWIVWILLINITIVMYNQIFRDFFWTFFSPNMGMYWQVFIFNTLALAVWETLEMKWQWLSERWAIRLIALASGVSITWLVLSTILDSRSDSVLSTPIWLAWLAGLYFIYRKLKPDLFMLAGGCLTGIVVTTTFLAKSLLENNDNAGSFLLLTLLVVGMGASAAMWLKKLHKEMQL